MRLHVLSDLHQEFESFTLPKVAADDLIFAGDVNKGTHGLEWILQSVPETPVAYVIGNHEYYGHELPALTEKLRRLSEGTNVHVLENSSFEHGGVTFLGATLWTDFGLLGDELTGMLVAEEAMNDFRLISASGYRVLRAQRVRDIHAQSVAWLRSEFSAHPDRPSVVITHHLPSAKSIPPKFRGDPLNVAFASALDDLVAASGAACWIHGHTHDSLDYHIAKTRVLNNPRGYPHEFNPAFNPEFVVEI